MREKLSAYIDAEANDLEARRVLETLSVDVELRGAWERYHLIRATLRKEVGLMPARDLIDRIRAQIEDTATAETDTGTGTGTRWGRFVIGMGIAASVAVLAIFSLQVLNPGTNNPSAQVASQVRSTDFIRTRGTHWDTDRPEIASTLNVYLVEHNEFMPTNGMGGMFPYVRVVTYDTDR